MSNSIRIAIAGGGTGGHIYPLLAIVSALNKLTHNYPDPLDIRYYGPRSIYWSILANNGILISPLWGSKFRRYFDLMNLVDVPIFFCSLLQAFWKMFWFMPDVIFSKGGSGSLAALLAAAFYKIPVIIHESDTIPSLTTRLSAKFAKRIAISFEETAKYLNKYSDVLAFTGNPLREIFLEDTTYDQVLLKKELGFNSELPVLFFLGGSQGAEVINDFIVNNLRNLLQKFQIIHQTGFVNYKSVKEATKSVSRSYLVFGSLEEKKGEGTELKRMIQASDLIISRAGSGAIFEIAVLGKPSILIPLEGSASNHQKQNAYEYAKSGASEVIEEDNFLPHLLINQVEKILNNKEKYSGMSSCALMFAKKEAAVIIAKEILQLAQKS